MLHKANFSGVNNLKTTQYRQDSPINSMLQRFPDKFTSNKRQDSGYAKDEKGHSRERISFQQPSSSKNQTTQFFSNLSASPRFKLTESNRLANVVDSVLPPQSHDQSMRFLEGMFKPEDQADCSQEAFEGRQKERSQFLERTIAENQFVLEASFCAVSDILMEGLGDGFDQWMALTLVDKILQFTSLLQHMRKDIRLGGLVGIYQLIKDQIDKGIREDVQNVVVEEIFLTLEDADQ